MRYKCDPEFKRIFDEEVIIRTAKMNGEEPPEGIKGQQVFDYGDEEE